MILRLLILALLLYLLFVLVSSALGRNRKGGRGSERGQDMVLDPHCKSYVPRKDAYEFKGHHFCSEACAKAYLGE